MEPTPVIFRVWLANSPNVLALFPDIPWNRQGTLCTSYESCGQHGGADYEGCMTKTRPAKPREYVDLLEELESIGYRLIVKSRRYRKIT